MAFKIVDASRSMARLKLAMAGASGTGKTLSALLVAYGYLKAKYPKLPDAEVWQKICVLDTENGSGVLYKGKHVAGVTIGTYKYIAFPPPFTAAAYREAIDLAERSGIEFLIIDSFSHAWNGVGGALDRQSAIAIKSGNSYTAWRDITPDHNALVDKILQCNMEVIATMRAKTEYVIEKNEKGKSVPRKVGTEPIQRSGVEYEFTTVWDISDSHVATTSKDRTGIFDSRSIVLDPSAGRMLYEWAKDNSESTAEATPAPQMKVEPAPDAPPQDDTLTEMQKAVTDAISAAIKASPDKRAEIISNVRLLSGGEANPANITDKEVLVKLYDTYATD